MNITINGYIISSTQSIVFIESSLYVFPFRMVLFHLVTTGWILTSAYYVIIQSLLFSIYIFAGRPGSSEVPRNPLTRWDVSSIPANGIFSLTKKLKNENENTQRVEND